jgi:hypothetical protein
MVSSIKISSFNGNIEGQIKNYSPCFIHVPLFRASIKKYGLQIDHDDDPMMLMVSQNIIQGKIPPYNVIVSVTGSTEKIR